MWDKFGVRFGYLLGRLIKVNKSYYRALHVTTIYFMLQWVDIGYYDYNMLLQLLQFISGYYGVQHVIKG